VKVNATVVLASGVSLWEGGCDRLLPLGPAEYMYPRSVSLIGELPRTGLGKLLKRELQAPHWAWHASRVWRTQTG